MTTNKTRSTELTVTKAIPPNTSKVLAQAAKSGKSSLEELKRTAINLHNEILNCSAFLALCFYQIGNFLRAVKLLKPRGQFTEWVETECKDAFGLRTAQRYMAFSFSVEKKMPQLRRELQATNPDLNVDELSDEDVLRRLPSSTVFSMLAESKDSQKRLLASNADTPVLNQEFKSAIVHFLGQPDLILTSITLSPTEIESPEIVTGNKPTDGRTHWPFTVLCIMGPSASVKEWCDHLFQAAADNAVREALILISSSKLFESNDQRLVLLPQLAFVNSHPFSSSAGKACKNAKSLLLLSDADRIGDFAKAFQDFGIVKVPFCVP